MPRLVAFLRGVLPSNAQMPALRQCFEAAGFGHVVTVLSSGNVVFDAELADLADVARQCEAAMLQGLGHRFSTLVRTQAHLQALLATDPYQAMVLEPQAKRVVSFLPAGVAARVPLPMQADGATLLLQRGGEAFSAYVPGPKGPVFMRLIEKAYGTAVTTRTWDTVRKCAQA